MSPDFCRKAGMCMKPYNSCQKCPDYVLFVFKRVEGLKC